MGELTKLPPRWNRRSTATNESATWQWRVVCESSSERRSPHSHYLLSSDCETRRVGLSEAVASLVVAVLPVTRQETGRLVRALKMIRLGARRRRSGARCWLEGACPPCRRDSSQSCRRGFSALGPASPDPTNE